MSAAWAIALPDSEKLVLLALADWSDDAGLCWPSVKKLAEKCSKSERTIQGALKSLEAKGQITRDQRPGHGCKYTIHPRSGCTPAESAPPQRLRQTPAAAAPNTSLTRQYSEANASSSPAPQPKPKARDPAKGTRLPETWEPTPADHAYAANLGLTPEEIARAALEFRNYWCARAGRDATKLRWDLTWNNRVLAIADRKRGPSASRQAPGGNRQDARSMAEIIARRRREAADREPLSG